MNEDLLSYLEQSVLEARKSGADEMHAPRAMFEAIIEDMRSHRDAENELRRIADWHKAARQKVTEI